MLGKLADASNTFVRSLMELAKEVGEYGQSQKDKFKSNVSVLCCVCVCVTACVCAIGLIIIQ